MISRVCLDFFFPSASQRHPASIWDEGETVFRHQRGITGRQLLVRIQNAMDTSHSEGGKNHRLGESIGMDWMDGCLSIENVLHCMSRGLASSFDTRRWRS
jgi:hypothetical protein